MQYTSLLPELLRALFITACIAFGVFWATSVVLHTVHQLRSWLRKAKPATSKLPEQPIESEVPTRAEYSRIQADYLASSRVAEAHRLRILLGEIKELPPEQQLTRLYAAVLDTARGNSVAEEIWRLLHGKIPYKGAFNPFGPLPSELQDAFDLEDYLFELKAKVR